MAASVLPVRVAVSGAADNASPDKRVKLFRFAEPEPRRSVGLAWRRTSPRKADFLALGQVVTQTLEMAATAQ